MDDQPRVCPRCGFPSARLKRLDHYISLFFIPLIPIKRGERFLECGQCGEAFDEAGQFKPTPLESRRLRSCPGCGREMARDFKYCPYCGEAIG